MKSNLLFLPFPICIFIFSIIIYLSGVWMFFSAIIASIGVISLYLIEDDLIFTTTEDKSIIKIYKLKGASVLKKSFQSTLTYFTVSNAICFILSFYPFAFMNESFAYIFSVRSLYEGGFFVSIITLFNIACTGGLLAYTLYDIINYDKVITKVIKDIEEDIREEYFQNIIIQESQLKRKKLIDSIAPADKIITIGDTLFALSKTNNKVIIGEKIFNLSDIISFSISDNSQQILTPSISHTKTKTSSMIGRAIVGSLISGGVGAIIGGTTAQKETITEGGTSEISHNYTIHLSMDSLREPLISIPIGSDSIEMEHVKALFNVIVKHNSLS